MNYMGQDIRFRLLGRLMLLIVRNTRLSMTCRIAGRRLVTAFAGAPAILLTNTTLRDALHDPKLLYRATAYTVKEMGLDTLCLFADMSLEAEACGCEVQFDDINVPVITSHIVTTEDDIAMLKVPDPYCDGRMPVFLETMRLMKKNFSILKVSEVIGPFTLATQLTGSGAYVDTRKNPKKLKALLAYCEKVIVRYAQALIKAGSDLILIADPSASQLSVSGYEEFSLSYTRKIIYSLNRQCILHICGQAEHLVEKMCQTGATALSFDDVDISSVIKLVPEGITVVGNISPLNFLQCSPEEIRAETRNLLETIKQRKEFLLAPGCDLAPKTPLANVLAFTEVVKA